MLQAHTHSLPTLLSPVLRLKNPLYSESGPHSGQHPLGAAGTTVISDPGCLYIVSTCNRSSGSSDVVPLPRMFEFLPQQAGLKRSRGNKRFSPYEVSRRSASSMTWTHKFVCLSDCSHDEVPNVSDKFKLKCAGLGEKKIVFRLDGKYAELKETLFLLWRREGGLS